MTKIDEKKLKKPPHWFGRTYLDDDHRLEVVVCSNCKTEFSYDAEFGYGAEDYNYCPNCGIKMGKAEKPLCGQGGLTKERFL